MPDPARQQLHTIVRGRVQGVSFRYHTQQNAATLELTGWVRNRPDGTVEVVAEGPTDQLKRLLRFLYDGPPAAVVEDVQITWQPATDAYRSFQIRMTGSD